MLYCVKNVFFKLNIISRARKTCTQWSVPEGMYVICSNPLDPYEICLPNCPDYLLWRNKGFHRKGSYYKGTSKVLCGPKSKENSYFQYNYF